MTTVETLLRNSRTVAVVGLSADPEKASNRVASFLKEQGYTIIPVNPGEKEILGEKCYPDITSVPVHIDIVDIFRKPEDVPPVVEQAIAAKAGAVWMQLGISHREAAAAARKAGLKVVMNKCMLQEHHRLFGED